MLPISQHVAVPEDELQFQFSRSSGPGGQNVNKVNSKATLLWNVTQSASLPEAMRQRFLARYAGRINRAGILVLSSQEFRDQPRNVQVCREKLVEMLKSVLRPPKARRPTKPTRGSRQRRMESKRHQSAKKERRRIRGSDR
jgi:ribosome-associated protein